MPHLYFLSPSSLPNLLFLIAAPLCAQTLGVDLVVMTPARGYCAELSAVVIIALATVYGLPVSTTQVMVSACLKATHA